MGDKILSNESKKHIQNDSERNFDNSEPFALLHTDAVENFQSRFQPIDDKGMFGYTSQNTFVIGSGTIEENFMETQEFDSSRFHNFSQQQIPSHGEPSNSHFKCIYSNEKNWELQQKRYQKDSNSISVVGRCIRTACDVLQGMDYEKKNNLSESIDSQHNDFIPSEFNVFHSKKETSSCKDILSDKNKADTHTHNKHK
ncbi:hypothetical protein TNIN_33591 [Trichonephila inaurata madagascariensis]|uniref:Uncharacterized protein n=1 Tax=Trichonephila inaurata madagascariensis TaxID=2747483 RepID=A0A8X6X2M6_9ARAC|nr:hypothetical protein TNIN_33591 [Trichonephila inaurata madagascariensis]